MAVNLSLVVLRSYGDVTVKNDVKVGYDVISDVTYGGGPETTKINITSTIFNRFTQNMARSTWNSLPDRTVVERL